MSGPVTAAGGLPAWLRLMVEPQPEGKIWEGAALAEAPLGEAVPRPVMLGERTWQEEQGAFQAIPWTRLRGKVLSLTPDLS